jgi:hypothetical protein
MIEAAIVKNPAVGDPEQGVQSWDRGADRRQANRSGRVATIVASRHRPAAV